MENVPHFHADESKQILAFSDCGKVFEVFGVEGVGNLKEIIMY